MLVYDRQQELIEWASQGIFGTLDAWDEKAVAIGVEHEGKIIAAVVYTDYHPHCIDMHIYTVDKRWCNRHTLKAFFAYPFIQLGLERVQSVIRTDNEGAITLLKKLGYTREGTHPKAYFGGVDAYSYGLLKHQCKWI